MTVLAVGTCMFIAVAAETRWKGPRILAPMLWLGQRSYEVYLSHMFIVVWVFGLYIRFGKPLRAVPLTFLIVILLSAVLGEIVARFYSEPMNRLLRRRSGDDSSRLGSVVDDASDARHLHNLLG